MDNPVGMPCHDFLVLIEILGAWLKFNEPLQRKKGLVVSRHVELAKVTLYLLAHEELAKHGLEIVLVGATGSVPSLQYSRNCFVSDFFHHFVLKLLFRKSEASGRSDQAKFMSDNFLDPLRPTRGISSQTSS